MEPSGFASGIAVAVGRGEPGTEIIPNGVATHTVDRADDRLAVGIGAARQIELVRDVAVTASFFISA